MGAATIRFRAGLGFALSPEGSDPAANSAELYFIRTAAGEVELRQHCLDLPRVVRDLLFAIEQYFTIDQCVGAVRGARLADAMLLMSLTLIRIRCVGKCNSANGGSVTVLPAIEAILALSPDDLYGLLTQQAKHRLGLLQGFRMVLALERCNSHHEQRALAVRFIQEIWRTRGEAGIVPLQRLLSV